MLFKKLNTLVEKQQRKKNNIYVYIELQRLVQRIEMSDDIRTSLVNQVACFHLIDPKDFSASLAPDWIAIRNFIGYDGSAKNSNAEMMKAPIRARVNKFTQADINTLLKMLHAIQSRLEADFVV
jgi:hypothetical protein